MAQSYLQDARDALNRIPPGRSIHELELSAAVDSILKHLKQSPSYLPYLPAVEVILKDHEFRKDDPSWEADSHRAISAIIGCLQSQAGQPTTAPDTKAEARPAEEPTGQGTPASSPLDTDSLIAEVAAKSLFEFADRLAALASEYRTRARGALPMSSISATQEAPSSAESPAPAGSGSSESDLVRRFASDVLDAIQGCTNFVSTTNEESHYKQGLIVAEELIKLGLRRNGLTTSSL